MESMAYIIETKLEPHASGAKDYPYNSALMVANYFYPGFEKDLLRLLALCDISLMMSNPADIFIKYLKYYQQEDHMPTPFEIYDKFYNEFHSFSGKTCSVREGLLEFFYTMSSYLSSYVDEKVDTGFSAITKSLIYKGLNLRLNRPYFFVELASSGQLIYNHLFSNLLYDFGSPLIRDIKNHYSIYIPQNNAINNKSKYNFSLGMWTAIEQIYNTLYLGVDGCEMLEWCEGSKSMTNNAPIIDDRCINCPWKRCHDANLCPYAILWRHWNLSNIKVDKTSNS